MREKPREFWEFFNSRLVAAVFLAAPAARTTHECERTFAEIVPLGHAPALGGLLVTIARKARELTGDEWYVLVAPQTGREKIENILSDEGQREVEKLICKGLSPFRGSDWADAQFILEDETAGMSPAEALLQLMQDCAIELGEIKEIMDTE